MLKVLVLAELTTAKTLTDRLKAIKDCQILAVIAPGEYDAMMQQKYKADLIVSNHAALTALLAHFKVTEPRTQVKAITHQGIRLVPVENIYYFQAEHKYVTAHHTQGQLLIEDTLNSLEREFATAFVRIHRKTLVARHKIETLMKNEKDQYFIKLHGRSEALMVSRRQLPHVRKVVLNI